MILFYSGQRYGWIVTDELMDYWFDNKFVDLIYDSEEDNGTTRQL